MKFPEVHSVLISGDTGRGLTVSDSLKPRAAGFSSRSCWEDKLDLEWRKAALQLGATGRVCVSALVSDISHLGRKGYLLHFFLPEHENMHLLAEYKLDICYIYGEENQGNTVPSLTQIGIHGSIHDGLSWDNPSHEVKQLSKLSWLNIPPFLLAYPKWLDLPSVFTSHHPLT